MPTSITSVSFRIDTDLKNRADDLFQSLGMNMTTAFNIFLKQAVREGGIPFRVTTNPIMFNEETIKAFKEAEALINDKTKKTFAVEEALEELKK